MHLVHELECLWRILKLDDIVSRIRSFVNRLADEIEQKSDV